MTDLLSAFLSDVVNDCVNGQTGPTDWTETNRAALRAWYEQETGTQHPLTAFDAVVMRKDPPFDMEFVYSTYLLEQAERDGVLIVA